MTNKPMLSVELRALLESISNGAYCKPAVMAELRALLDKEVDMDSDASKHQGEVVAWASPKALEALKEVGWMHVGSIGGDTAVPLFLCAENTAPVVTVAKLIQAIHGVEGFPGVAGDQLRELAARLNGVKS